MDPSAPVSHLSLLSSLHPWCLSRSWVPSLFQLLLLLLLDSRGEEARRPERHGEKRVTKRQVLYEAISVPVKLRCSLHRLSSSLSVWLPKCLFSLALFPVFSFSGGKLGEHSALHRIHTGTVGATENEKMSLEGCVCVWMAGGVHPPLHTPQ